MLAVDDMPTWFQAALVVVLVVQFGLEGYALYDLWKTPVERIRMGAKWPWIIIILFVNMVGAIIYLAAGRKPAPVVEPPSLEADAARSAAAVDALYGAGPENDPR
ncbi:MAG: PLD nuclease N-terminal domain-containing protein [Coriobacteriia bacterium]|nr:PLD nuclease N-terminal domain-containing protein [Coriobacteriia bacterium]